jgi:ribosomal protein L16 Arg81 hydroxylase
LFDLARLIDPIDVQTFKREYWEEKPLIVHRRDPSYFADLLSLADVDGILNSSNVHSTDVQLVRSGIPRDVGKADGRRTSAESWFAEYRSGSTIVLQSLHNRWLPLKQMCRRLGEEFSAGFQVNVYLTPPRAQGFSTHYDTHDVFVVQAAGSKRWRVYAPTIELPLYGQPFRREVHPAGPVLHDFDLHAGDVMYLPRGYAHDASSMGETSLHLAVGALTITWASVLLGAVEAAIEGDPLYRRSLPPGFARDDESPSKLEEQLHELSNRLIANLDIGAAATDAIERAHQSMPPHLDGHLVDLELESTVNLQTRLSIRPGAADVRMAIRGDSVSLEFHGKRVSMPAAVYPALEFISRTRCVTAEELSGGLDEASRLTLVRRLIREGYLTIVREEENSERSVR